MHWGHQTTFLATFLGGTFQHIFSREVTEKSSGRLCLTPGTKKLSELATLSHEGKRTSPGFEGSLGPPIRSDRTSK